MRLKKLVKYLSPIVWVLGLMVIGGSSLVMIGWFAYALQTMGVIVGVIALVAIIGYLLDISVLDWTVPGLSSAMAAHTALFFLFLRVAFYLVGHEKAI